MAVTLNSLAIFPSDIQLEVSKIGVPLVMASGTRRFAHRLSGATPLYKSTWTLTWDSTSAAQRTIAWVVYAYSVPFTFVDQYAQSWTVQCEDSGYSESVSEILGDGTLLYNLSLKLFQV